MQLEYFKEEEFAPWQDDMDLELLKVLDRFRGYIGVPVIISPANGALGRRLPLSRKSFHNVNLHGRVMAADIFVDADYPVILECAIRAGARGIGFYPDWNPSNGVHLDVGNRDGRWSAFTVDGRQKYYSIDYALSGRRP